MDNPEKPEEVFNKLAQEYMDRFMEMDLYNDTYDLFLEQIPDKGADVLEIGCGPGNISRYLLTRRPDLQLLGIDLAPNMIELARQNNPSAEFRIMDAREIGNFFPDLSFQAVMVGFCLPYLSKEETIDLIRHASQLLSPGGVLYLSTMEDDYENSRVVTSSNGSHELFIYFHQADYLSEALVDNGLQLIEQKRQAFPDEETAHFRDLILIAVKG